MSLKIISLNVNGICDNTKRQIIFHWLKQQNSHICFIQETHCHDTFGANNWSAEWGGKCFWSLGTSLARGVAILFQEKLDIKISNEIVDINGRYIYITIEVDECKVNLLNVYAPNNGNERVRFFNNIKQIVKDKEELIIGGDFNCCISNNEDRRYAENVRERREDQGVTEMKELMIENNLEDVWRRRHPNLKRYSYFKKNSKSASRIDIWLIEKSLDPLISKTTIIQAVCSDHSAIQLVLKTNKQDRGTGYWKLNSSILENERFHNSFIAFWSGWKKEINKYESKKEWWEATKCKIKNL